MFTESLSRSSPAMTNDQEKQLTQETSGEVPVQEKGCQILCDKKCQPHYKNNHCKGQSTKTKTVWRWRCGGPEQGANVNYRTRGP